jgi:Tol biopolymer transport system component
VIRLDGSASRNLSNDQHFDGWPTWTPDGRWILFASGREGIANSGQVYRIRPDGTGLQQITGGPSGHVQPSVSADGRKLLVYQVVEQEGTELGQIARFDLEEAQ